MVAHSARHLADQAPRLAFLPKVNLLFKPKSLLSAVDDLEDWLPDLELLACELEDDCEDDRR
jgi:hypothetical protein